MRKMFEREIGHYMKEIILHTPLLQEDISSLRVNERILVSGTIYTARDTAHKRIIESIQRKEKLPFDLEGACIYYAGPSPAPPNKPIGAIGPTTSYRMDDYTPELLAHGLKLMIGKGARSKNIRQSLCDHQAVYAAAWGGAGALLASKVLKAECIAYHDLGPEAIYALEVQNFPALVINDTLGNDAYEMRGNVS